MRLLTLPLRLAWKTVKSATFLLLMTVGASALAWKLRPERKHPWLHRLMRLFQ